MHRLFIGYLRDYVRRIKGYLNPTTSFKVNDMLVEYSRIIDKLRFY